QHYLAVEVYTEKQEEEQAWCGFCESRIRKLVESLAYNPPLCRLRAFPKKFPLSFVTADDAPPADKSTTGEAPPSQPSKFGVCFFVGFDVDRRQLRSREVSIDNSVEYFKHNDLYRWNKRTPTMDVRITPAVWKSLPDVVFEDMGGRAAARVARREFMKKKKEEEKAAEVAAAPSPALSPAPSPVPSPPPTGGSGDESMKDVQSQETDGGGEDASGGEKEASPVVDVASGKGSFSAPGSPDPASEGSDEAAKVSEKLDNTPLKAKKEVAATSSPELSGKRDRDGKAVDGAGSPDGKPLGAAHDAATTSINGAATRELTSPPVKVVKKPLELAVAPPAVSSPRKRRKMKITFAKLN
ncbi:hypothetical protein BBJ28_00006711, partial [Nothophytophthora sp. Chile5]